MNSPPSQTAFDGNGLTLVRQASALHREIASAARTVLVPTMGALHEGHLSLVRRARQLGEVVIVSIYVNPLQFGPNEDFADYPRRLTVDCEKLAGLADVVYAPDENEMFSEKQVIGISLPLWADEWCGKSRPGFFQGVATIVAKLFNQVRPTAAVFGRKDYQQARLIDLMTRQLNWQIKIDLQPTVREPDGLALSSRNIYLSEDERKRAPALSGALQTAAAAIIAGRRDWDGISKDGEAALAAAGLQCDYFTVLSADFSPPEEGKVLVILAAAWLGSTRLIDNLEVLPRQDGDAAAYRL